MLLHIRLVHHFPLLHRMNIPWCIYLFYHWCMLGLPNLGQRWIILCYPEDLPNPGIGPGSSALQVDSLPSEPPGKPNSNWLGAVESHQEEGWVSSGTVAPHRRTLSLLWPHQRTKQLAEEGYPLRHFHLCSSLFSRVWRVRQDRGYLGCRRRLPEALLEGTNASIR